MRGTGSLLFLTVFIQGCITMPQITNKVPITPRSVKVDANVGVQQAKDVGDTMITKATYSTYLGFVANKDFANSQPGFPQIIKDAKYICMGKIPTGEYICNQHHENTPEIAYINLPSVVINNVGDLVGYYHLVYYKPLEVPQCGVFQEADMTSISATGFKRELIYNGKSKDNIKILYREFSGNLARPAFSQELMYDLSESRVIGFKDIRIRIIEATNTNIKFEVLQIEGQSANSQ